ncbi:MAG TPA: MFS transporter [Alphaproteobacteria bacterium]|nr:MFS transporter [Alphaproteobacteria bacterium]
MNRIALAAISIALVLNMTGYLTVAAILPDLLAKWGLSESEAGWLASWHMGVYAVAAVLLLPLTDRIDPKKVIIASLFCGAVGGFGFAWLADGFWSGLAFRSLVGVAQAGVYMPGLKVIADSLEGRERSKATALYSSMVPLGSGLSLLLPSVLPAIPGWQFLFEITGMAGLAGMALVAASVPKRRSRVFPHLLARNPYTFGHVLRNRTAMRYVLSYAGHVWETFGFRAWVVTFLLFSAATGGNGISSGHLTVFAAVIVIAGMPASILVGNWSVSFALNRVLRLVGISSLCASILLAAYASVDFYVVLALSAIYGIIGFADQGALGSAIVDAAEPDHRGATLAIYTLFGFGSGMLGAVTCGFVLEMTGGISSASAWQWLWLTCGGGSLVVTLLLAPKPAFGAIPAKAAVPIRVPRWPSHRGFV